MAEIRLYDSTICRLCAEENDNGEMLFTDESEETDLSGMINRYLPLKVYDDGKLPRTICPGCNIQLEATVQFFQLLDNGQRKIREMWNNQLALERKKIDQYKDININSSTELTRDDEEHIFINVIPDGSAYASEHELSLQMEGLDKPRKKRGRPPKGLLDEMKKSEYAEEMSQEDDEETEGEGSRKRRKRKVPKRYMESVQGKELDKIFKEEGVLDDEDEIKQTTDEHADISALDSSNSDTEIIGHMETSEGTSLNEFVLMNKKKSKLAAKSKTKRKHKFICSHCGKGFLQRSKYIVHKSLHDKITHYECTECGHLFANQEELAIHKKIDCHSEEQESKNFIAPFNENDLKIESTSADEMLRNSPELRAENQLGNVENDTKNMSEESMAQNWECTDDDSFKCVKCNKHFQSKDTLVSHVKVVHQGEKPYLCDICHKTFAYDSSLKGHKEMYHQAAKTEKGFPCDICGKVLNHSSSVMYHKTIEHNGRRFVCNKCGKSFKHKQLLQRHQLVHSEDRPYPCKSCNASFKTKANLLNHQSTHTGERKHACELCNQKFAHKTSLTLHYRTHTGQKPYKCEICSKCFSQNGNLQEHMRIHTGEKPYCCDHCGRKFTTSSQFKLHVKRHTGERPWKCDKCTKSFLHKDTWKCHVRRHNGERPFVCSHCTRAFTEQWALKKHLRLHTGEKPYSCDICGKAFADCSNLTKHKKVHKKISESEKFLNDGMWQILPNIPEPNAKALGNFTQVITTDQEDGTSQIVYVAYHDAENSNETTIQFQTEQDDDDHEDSNKDLQDPIQTKSDFQLQLTDEYGNAIPLTMARQFLSGGQLLQNVRIADITPDEISSSADKNATMQADAQAICQVLEDPELPDGQPTIEFLTEDGQKVRLVTASLEHDTN